MISALRIRRGSGVMPLLFLHPFDCTVTPPPGELPPRVMPRISLNQFHRPFQRGDRSVTRGCGSPPLGAHLPVQIVEPGKDFLITHSLQRRPFPILHEPPDFLHQPILNHLQHTVVNSPVKFLPGPLYPDFLNDEIPLAQRSSLERRKLAPGH